MAGRNSLLAADIGGTYARFAVVDPHGRLGASIRFACDDFADPHALLAAALEAAKVRPALVSLALAGPVDAGAVTLTNRPWRFDALGLAQVSGLPVLLHNDLEALARAAPVLDPGAQRRLGGTDAAAGGRPIAVMGVGTGLGTALADPATGRVWAAEGGHADLPATDDLEAELVAILRRTAGHVSAEHVLSGPGLARLHRAMAEVWGLPAPERDAAAVAAEARAGDPLCLQTVETFVGMLGGVAGNLVLSCGARGGLFLAGGVARHLAVELERGPFRQRFEDKGRMAPYLAPVPVRLVTDDAAGLRGAALFGLDRLQGVVAGSAR